MKIDLRTGAKMETKNEKRIQKIWLLSLLFFLATNVTAQQVKLGWTASEDISIVEYRVYRSTHPDSAFTLLSTVTHPESTFTDAVVVWDERYYYAATSRAENGNESGYSNVVDTLLTNPLPVELEVFQAFLEANSVILKWVTATESNNYGFEIERSEHNPKNFNKIAFVRGNGTATSPNRYQYTDQNVAIGKYFYRLKQIDFNGEIDYSGIVEISAGIPTEFRLQQNYPNPFNPVTRINYSLPKSANVELTVFDVNGQEVKNLVNKFQEVGNYEVAWNGTDRHGFKVASGVYYYKIRTDFGSQFRRMLLLK
jgi:hypothetical protein